MGERVQILDLGVPSNSPGVRGGYEVVVLGIASAGTRSVEVGFSGGTGPAAVIPVNRSLARRVGAPRPFSLFIAELPVLAACRRISVRARTAAGTRIRHAPARRKVCDRAMNNQDAT
ncbi:MAG: hypothetical protein ACRDL3_15725 [Solirubrobacterales bacterium]